MAQGFKIASAWVDINADTSNLKRDAKAGIVRELKGLSAAVQLKAKTTGLRREAQRDVKTALKGLTGDVRLTVDSGRLRASSEAAIKRATRGLSGSFELRFDAGALRTNLKARIKTATKGLKIHIPIKADATGLRAELRAAIAAAQAGLDVSIPVNLRGDPILRTITRVNNAAGGMSRRMRMWAGVILASIGGIAPAIGTIVNALSAMGPALLSGVAAASSLALVFGTLAIGGNGVAHAIAESAEGTKKFEEALAMITPEAQKFVRAVVGSKGAFKGMQTAIQDLLMQDLDESFRRMAKTTIPDLQGGLGGTAIQLNTMTKSAMASVETLSRMGTLKVMFGGLQRAFQPLVPMPGQFLNMLVKTTIAATPLWLKMTTAMGRGVDSLNAKVDRMFASGELQGNIDRSAQAIANFFKKIGNNPEWQEFVNQIKTTGPELAEVLGRLAEAFLKIINNAGPLFAIVLKIADGFARLVNAIPDEIIATILGVAGAMKIMAIAGVAWRAVVGSAAVASLTAFVTAARMSGVATAIRGVAAAMTLLQKASVVLMAISAVVLILNKLTTMGKETPPAVDKLTKSLENFAKSGQVTGEMAEKFGSKFEKLGENINEVTKPSVAESINNWGKKWSGGLLEGGEATENLDGKIKSLDEALSDMVQNGNAKLAKTALEGIIKNLKKQGADTGKVTDKLKDYKQALQDQAIADQWAADSMGVFGEAAMATSRRLQELKDDTEGLSKALFALNQNHRDAGQALGDYEKSADALVALAKKRGINLTYENGVLSQNNDLQREAAAGLRDMADKTEKAGLAAYTSSGNWQNANRIFQQGKQTFIDNAVAMGLNREAATLLANSYLKIPSQKEITLMVKDQATTQLAAVKAAFEAAPKQKTIKVDALSGPAIVALQDLGFKVEKLPDGSFTVTAKTAGAKGQLKDLQDYKLTDKRVQVLMSIVEIQSKIDTAQAKVDGLKQKRKTAVGADKKKLDEEIKKAQKKVDDLKQKRATEIKALDKTGPGVKSAKDNVNSVKDKKVTISVFTALQQSNSDIAAAIQRQADAQARKAKGKRYGGIIRRASGGFVSGPGGPTADRVAALLSNGEFVMRASSVKKYGTGMMGAINTGKFPKFAKGGSVSGSSGSSSVSAAAETGTFKVTDETGKPIASAVNNFKALSTAAAKTYVGMNADTSAFGKALTSEFGSMGGRNAAVWAAWQSGMKSGTNSTYKSLSGQTNAFGTSQVTRLTQTRTGSHSVWQGWKSGMESRTKSTYANINNATSSFSKQSVAKMGNARDGMGSAWGGLSPKFKPPVSYLVHSVINKGIVGSMNAIMSKLGGGKKVGGISVAGFATGGPVYGAGTKTSDSIPARLSNGEFVMQAKAVDKFGTGFMNAVNQGRMPRDGAGFTGFSKGGGVNIKMAPGFATGGSVGIPSSDTLNKVLGDGGNIGAKRMTDFIMNNYVLPLIDSGSGGSAMKDVQRAAVNHIRGNVEAFVKENFGGAGSASAGLRWARTQYGKPYQWGGNGNPSWDCSGFMSAIESVIRGEKPHRRWSTHAFNGGTPPGWKLGANAPFRVGITHAGVGHTAGTVGKENVESSGGLGVHGGKSARGYNDSMFTSWYGYVGPNATKKAKGGYISGPGGPTADKVPAWLSNGEYVIRSAAVKKLGTGYLSALNSGRIPGFASGGSVGTYKIKYGDTLSELAVKFKTTVKELMRLNTNIKNANKIYAGQILRVPGSSSGGGTTTPKPPTSTDPFNKAPYVWPALKKFSSSVTESAEGLSALKGWVTLSAESIKAGTKNSEIIGSMNAAASMSELLEGLWETKGKITAAFKGSGQTTMLARFDSASTALIAWQKKLDPILGSLTDAKAKVEELTQSFDSMKNSVKDNVADTGKVTKIGKWGTNPATILNQLQTDVTKAGAFADQLKALKAKGINADMIGQIAEAGITGGGAATAASLLNMTPAQVAQLNALQAQLVSNADKAGTAAADGMYGAGLNAAKGLVAGLESQQKSIEAAMLKIAQAMETSIKQALGIKSPSRLMMKVADFTADGLVNQLGVRKPDVAGAMSALVKAPAAAAASVAAPRPVVAVQGRTGPYVDNRTVNLTVNVAGTFPLDSEKDRRTLAAAIGKQVKEEIRRDDKKHR